MEDLVNREQCPGCGCSLPGEKLFTVSQSHSVEMLKCENCHIATASKYLNEEASADLYDPKNYSSSLTADNSLSLRCSKRLLPFIAEVIQGKSSLRILDYGGGNGNLSKTLMAVLSREYPELDIHADVVDIYPREACGNLRFLSVEEFEQNAAVYDVLLASAILEHLTDVKPVLDKLLSSGVPGAVFYARTPYEVPLCKLLRTSMIRWPRHIHDIGPDYWDWCSKSPDVNVKIVESRTSLVETSFGSNFLRTMAAYALKMPSRLERTFVGKPLSAPFWKWVGGWEVFGKVQEK